MRRTDSERTALRETTGETAATTSVVSSASDHGNLVGGGRSDHHDHEGRREWYGRRYRSRTPMDYVCLMKLCRRFVERWWRTISPKPAAGTLKFARSTKAS